VEWTEIKQKTLNQAVKLILLLGNLHSKWSGWKRTHTKNLKQ